MPARSTETTGCLSVVVRLLWLVVGNIALVLLVIPIAEQKRFSAIDIAFWATVVALILVRYIDVHRLHGLTANGDPASVRDWRRYVLFLLLGSGALWGLAHAVLARYIPA